MRPEVLEGELEDVSGGAAECDRYHTKEEIVEALSEN
jgi:hypothetical protein